MYRVDSLLPVLSGCLFEVGAPFWHAIMARIRHVLAASAACCLKAFAAGPCQVLTGVAPMWPHAVD